MLTRVIRPNILLFIAFPFGIFLQLNGAYAQQNDDHASTVMRDSKTTEPAPSFSARRQRSYSVTGYVDNALIGNRLRLRFDTASDSDRPDRAEFFYAQCGCNPGNTPGNDLPETSLDYQELRLEGEYAFNDRFSLTASLPYRSINPEVNDDASGIGDAVAGLKFGILTDAEQQLTFQLLAYLPTGKSSEGLGTDHYSLEPGFLYFLQPADRWTLEAELKFWIPVNGSKNGLNGSRYSGNVLRYGVGLGYDLPQNLTHRITPVVEIVGWSVLDGYELNGNALTIESARSTIVNLKAGARVAFDEHNSVYAGYGTALTGDRWYRDIVRLEYRYDF